MMLLEAVFISGGVAHLHYKTLLEQDRNQIAGSVYIHTTYILCYVCVVYFYLCILYFFFFKSSAINRFIFFMAKYDIPVRLSCALFSANRHM